MGNFSRSDANLPRVFEGRQIKLVAQHVQTIPDHFSEVTSFR